MSQKTANNFQQKPDNVQKKREAGRYYRSLTRNMLLTVIIVSFTPMIVVSGIILYQFQDSYSEKVHAHLGELVLNHKQNIDTFLQEKLKHIRFLAKSYSFEELSNELFLQDQLFNLQEGFSPFFVDLGVVNERGVQVAYAGPFKLGKASYSTADWYEKAMKRKQVISDVFLGLRGLPHFIVAVKDNWQGMDWILRATIDFVAFNTLVEKIRIGETGFAFILNKEGEFQTQPLRKIVPEKGPYMKILERGGDKRSDIQILQTRDDSGEENIYVAAFLKEGDWLLVYQQKASDAFSDLENALRLAVAILLLGGLGIITMAFVLSKRMIARIAKVDQEKNMMDEQIIETGKLASVGELAAGIAHEINNPVAIMIEEAGWIEDLLEEEELKESENLSEFQRALKQIRTQGKRCKEITYKLLSFARKTDARIHEVNMNELLEELVALSSQRGKFSSVTIQTNFQHDLPLMKASESELQQVFLNLINNAIDAMEKGGGTLNISSRSEDDQIVVEVADDGPGIPKANLARIFDPFFTTKPVGKGTGLGLSICYGIVKKLGGEIEVHSVVDMGTTFRVMLPLPKAKEAENETAEK
jgi:two-component system NtrC family sensor kinase